VEMIVGVSHDPAFGPLVLVLQPQSETGCGVAA
jgi:acyl-CoA synthetase (NDP forming)